MKFHVWLEVHEVIERRSEMRERVLMMIPIKGFGAE
jgi:hypothetical protein